MAYQLVYTSSPRGLKPGAFGFCVVACTRGMKEQTTSALEALSGYRRIYADPRDASRNPTSCSHVLFETATGRLRILARVADAGLDYSGRTNKIASFLDVSENELAPPGPAALFSQPGLFVANWSSSSAPQYYEAPIALPNYVPIPLGCNEWRKTTGDPAWAGVLASTVATRRPVVLIARPEQNVLQLFQESLALLPPGERWKATFSTYYMKTPPGVQCQWKAVMQGSPEELALRSTPGALVLDLTNPINLPSLASLVVSQEEKALVAAASGRFQTNVGPTNAFKSVPSASPAVAAPPTAPGVAPLPGAVPMSAPTPYDLAPSDSPTSKRKTLNYGRDAILTVTVPETRAKTNARLALLFKLALYVFFATALIVSSVVITSYVMKDNGSGNTGSGGGTQQQTSSPTPETHPSESQSAANPVAEESKKDESKGSSTTEQEPKESTDSDKTNDRTSSSAAEKDQSPKDANNGVQKSKEKDNKDKAGEKDPKSGKDNVFEADSESDDEASNETVKKGKDDSNSDAKENENKAKKSTSSGKTDDVETDDESDGEASSGADGKNKSAPKTDEKTRDKRSDEIVDDVADEIEDNLAKFEREGGWKIFQQTKNLVGKYRQMADSSSKLKVAVDHFDKIQKALAFNSFKNLAWTGKIAKEKLKSSSNDVFEFIETGLYQDLNDFFTYFRSGHVKLIFRRYDDDGLTELPPYSITATEFRGNGKTADHSLGEGTKAEFCLDLQNQQGGLRFHSVESARKWLLHGTFEFKAFADTSSNESACVFHVSETPILDCSDLSVDLGVQKSLDLNWLFDENMPSFFNLYFDSDPESGVKPDANTFFVEYCRVDDLDIALETNLEAVKNISSQIVTNDSRRKNNAILTGNIKALSGVALEISFSLTGNKRGVKGECKRLYKITDKGKYEGYNSQSDLSSIKLTFNIRYRTSADQKPEASPIVGVLKIPLDFN